MLLKVVINNQLSSNNYLLMPMVNVSLYQIVFALFTLEMTINVKMLFYITNDY